MEQQFKSARRKPGWCSLVIMLPCQGSDRDSNSLLGVMKRTTKRQRLMDNNPLHEFDWKVEKNNNVRVV